MDNMLCEAWLRDCWLSWVMLAVPGDVVRNKSVVWLKESHHSEWPDLWPHLWPLKAAVSEVKLLHLAKKLRSGADGLHCFTTFYLSRSELGRLTETDGSLRASQTERDAALCAICCSQALCQELILYSIVECQARKIPKALLICTGR